jgi:predicted Zn-dependent protease
MLEKMDLERVFKAARQAGYVDTEVYAETRTQARVEFRDRIEDVRCATIRGLSLRCFDGQFTRQFFTHRIDTGGLLEVLGASGGVTADSAESLLPNALQPAGLPDRVSRLSALFKGTLLGPGDAIRHPVLTFEENVKYFEVAHDPKSLRGGVEETAELSISWLVGQEKRLHTFERCGTSIEGLLRELGSPDLAAAVRRSAASVAPWPAPQGEIPILWSARALSKIQLQFLRAFEGDLVLGNLSFLTELPLPVSLPFAVEDRPDTDRLACDNEGSPRRPVTVFNQGRPKALACNNRIARQLAVASTGHCRRQSFQTAPTVGFWNPRVVAHRTEDRPESALDWGLSVRDVDVVDHDLATGEITLRLRETYLVHQGEEGEPVESVVIRANLIDLLERLEEFSVESETVGLRVTKNQQRFITEVSTPRARSRPLPIPGTVPPSHYW